MLKIGLTGGIGSGKSTVAELFADLGITIIDADVIAREVVQPGSRALKQIAAHFGPGILEADETLNRRALRDKIFDNETERKWLEQLLHPLILEEMRQQSEKAPGTYCILVIPLLLEIAPYEIIGRILVVDAPETLQAERARQRDQLSQTQIDAILKAQTSRLQRLAVADDVIHNDGSLADLKQQVLKLHNRYLELSQRQANAFV